MNTRRHFLKSSAIATLAVIPAAGGACKSTGVIQWNCDDYFCLIDGQIRTQRAITLITVDGNRVERCSLADFDNGVAYSWRMGSDGHYVVPLVADPIRGEVQAYVDGKLVIYATLPSHFA